ncbi:hypothetical protein GCM10011507_10240 [Edaphobacter acidisoli]|uniref:NHL repeat containing protein n=1 Tax=Edaphobacter acidisoli TaxID=2040573 RepID=A0A916RLJ2_9BACT|nr:hypothetical protein [Edaphobacter acidisoli]GGA60655.1 hypothetical protein GCM10011507_10240 [Edaphobacter acidisoli]
MQRHQTSPQVGLLGLLALIAATAALPARAASFIGGFSTITILSSTIPTNGDVNPYGVALIPQSKGNLVAGNFLISNFNNAGNLQGTGTTIVQITPSGSFSLFAQIDPTTTSCPGGVGLTTALVVLRSGFVVVGSLPTTDGTSATIGSGCLIVLNSTGRVVKTITGNHLNGPWDMTAVDGGQLAALFVTNVLNDTVKAGGKVVHHGTVVRILLGDFDDAAPRVLDSTVIADGFSERTDPAALVIGPTGAAFDDSTGTLYVADSLNNRIAAIPNALFRNLPSHGGVTVSQGGAINDPLGLALAPNHDIITANGNDGNLVETNPSTGQQVAVKLVDNSGGPPPGAGALFGIGVTSAGVYFVDDATNTFNLLN